MKEWKSTIQPKPETDMLKRKVRRTVRRKVKRKLKRQRERKSSSAGKHGHVYASRVPGLTTARQTPTHAGARGSASVGLKKLKVNLPTFVPVLTAAIFRG